MGRKGPWTSASISCQCFQSSPYWSSRSTDSLPLLPPCKLLWLALFLSTSLQTFVSVVGFALSLITLSLVISLRQMCSSAFSMLMTPASQLQLSVEAFSWTQWSPGIYSTFLFAGFIFIAILNLKLRIAFFFLISLPYLAVFLMSVNGNSILILTWNNLNFSLSCPIF